MQDETDGTLTAARARDFWICWRRVIWDSENVYWRELQ